MERIVQTIHGYYSVEDSPTQKELEDYYVNKYYQDNAKSHSHQYSFDELEFFENKAKVAEYICNDLDNKTLLDVGAGEGFFANHFFSHMWKVTTLDYSDYGIVNHNPQLKNTVIKNDIFKSIKKLIKEEHKYGLVNLSNVLEHVIDPIALLKSLKFLLNDNSYLRISVPNDYSDFQEFLLSKNNTTNTWVSTPDHLHYFTFKSLRKLLESLNYEVHTSLGEFPIEIFLSNDASNYTKNRKLGSNAHIARVETDNFLFKQGIEKYIQYYKSSANIGFSRQVVIFVKKKD